MFDLYKTCLTRCHYLWSTVKETYTQIYDLSTHTTIFKFRPDCQSIGLPIGTLSMRLTLISITTIEYIRIYTMNKHIVVVRLHSKSAQSHWNWIFSRMPNRVSVSIRCQVCCSRSQFANDSPTSSTTSHSLEYCAIYGKAHCDLFVWQTSV